MGLRRSAAVLIIAGAPLNRAPSVADARPPGKLIWLDREWGREGNLCKLRHEIIEDQAKIFSPVIDHLCIVELHKIFGR